MKIPSTDSLGPQPGQRKISVLSLRTKVVYNIRKCKQKELIMNVDQIHNEESQTC